MSLAALLCASAAIVPATVGSAHGHGQGGPHGTGGPGESGGSGGSGGSNSGGSSADTSDGGLLTVSFSPSAATVSYPNSYSPSATSNPAGATMTYAISGSNSALCSIAPNGTSFGYAQVGTCVIGATATATSSTDDDHDGTSSVTGSMTLTVNPGPRSISLSLTPPSRLVGKAIILSATVSSGAGAITYQLVGDSTTGCSLTSDQLTSTSAGDCVVTATVAADTNYLAATSTPAIARFFAPPVVTPPPPSPPPPKTPPPPPAIATTTSTTTSTTTTTLPKNLTITAPTQSVKKGQSIRAGVAVSGAAPGDVVRVSSVTLTYTGIGGTSYGPNSAPPSQVGVYAVTPSHATISVSPSSDAKRYGSILYVAGTLQILPPDLVIKAAPPRLSPSRSLAIKPFAEGSYALTHKLVKQVARLALVIQRGKYHSVALTGFTDNVFTPAFNVVLNQRRAAAVQSRLRFDLLHLHVKNVKISIVTSFSVQLVSTNTTAKGRAQNRRVVAVLRAL